MAVSVQKGLKAGIVSINCLSRFLRLQLPRYSEIQQAFLFRKSSCLIKVNDQRLLVVSLLHVNNTFFHLAAEIIHFQDS